MAEKFDLDTLLKERGYDEWTKERAGKAAPEKTAGDHPYIDIPGVLNTSKLGGDVSDFASAIGRGAGQTILGAGDLMAKIPNWPFPGNVGDAMKSIPGMQKGVRTFREAVKSPPDAPIEEQGAEAVGGMLPFMTVPGTPLETMASRIASSVPRYIRGFGFVPTPNRARTAAMAGARYVGDPALMGGAAGAVSDPEHPAQGALEGMEGAAAMRLGGRALRTAAGNRLGNVAAWELPALVAHHYMGIPYWPYVGGGLAVAAPTRYGQKLSSGLSRLMERIKPSVSGSATTKTIKEKEREEERP